MSSGAAELGLKIFGQPLWTEFRPSTLTRRRRRQRRIPRERSPLEVSRQLACRGYFIGFGMFLFGSRGQAFAVKRDSLEQIHGAIQLDIASVADALLFFGVD